MRYPRNFNGFFVHDFFLGPGKNFIKNFELFLGSGTSRLKYVLWGHGFGVATFCNSKSLPRVRHCVPHTSRTLLELVDSISLSSTVALLLPPRHAVPVKPTSSQLAQGNQSEVATVVLRVIPTMYTSSHTIATLTHLTCVLHLEYTCLT